MTEPASELRQTQPSHQAQKVVYGYIRQEEPDEIEIALLRKDMGRYCLANGYHLGAVFVDRGVPDTVTARLAFSAMLDVLRLADAFGALLPHLDHLSTVDTLQTMLLSKIRGTASRVLTVYDTEAAE